MRNFFMRVDAGMERRIFEAVFLVEAKKIGLGGCRDRKISIGLWPLNGGSGCSIHT